MTFEDWAAVVDRARLGPVVVHLAGSRAPVEWFRRRGHRVLVAPVAGDLPRAFDPMRAVVRELLPEAEQAAGRPLSELGSELVALLPEPADRPAYADAVPLAWKTVGGTKRRLHRDSERLFRLVSAVAVVVGSALAGAAADSGPAVLVVEHADLCDRATLACLLHIQRRAVGPGPIIVLTTHRDRPLWRVPVPDDPLMARWTDAEREQDRVLARFLAATDADEIVGFPRREAAPRPGPIAIAPSDALRLAQRAFGSTLDYEYILLCCRSVLSGSPAAPERIAALSFAALAHAYLENHETAAEIFETAWRESREPEARAQICYYRGLLAAKRQGRLAEGRQWFERGLEHVSGRTTPAAVLERGWLANGSALVAWREGRLADAQALVCSALSMLAAASPERGGPRDPQLANLHVNLVNNLSVLHEATGRLPAALEAWRSLRPWTGELRGRSFAKSYFYRESWLLLQLGRPAEAYESAATAHELARSDHDVFHLDVIGRACLYLACRCQAYEDALAWARWLEALAGGDPGRAAEGLGRVAHVLCQSGDHDAAVAVLEEAVGGSGAGRWDAALKVVTSLRDDAPEHRPGPDDDLGGLRLDRPRAKLTSPFPLAQLVGDDAFSLEGHRRAVVAAPMGLPAGSPVPGPGLRGSDRSHLLV